MARLPRSSICCFSLSPWLPPESVPLPASSALSHIQAASARGEGQDPALVASGPAVSACIVGEGPASPGDAQVPNIV